MLHTYGNSKAEGRELCFQRLETAGQDYSLTVGEQATVTAPAPGGHRLPARVLGQVLSWLSHTLLSAASRSLRRAPLLYKELIWVPGAPAGWPSSCKDAQCHSSLPPVFLFTLHPGREALQELAFPLGISPAGISRSLMRNLDAQFRC